MTVVVKEQLCGKDCEGCPHGPYAYRVTTNSEGSQSWEYLGKAGAVKEVDTEDEGEDLTNTSKTDSISDEIIDDLRAEVGFDIDKEGVDKLDNDVYSYRATQDGEDVIVVSDGDIATSIHASDDYSQSVNELISTGDYSGVSIEENLLGPDKIVLEYDEGVRAEVNDSSKGSQVSVFDEDDNKIYSNYEDLSADSGTLRESISLAERTAKYEDDDQLTSREGDKIAIKSGSVNKLTVDVDYEDKDNLKDSGVVSWTGDEWKVGRDRDKLQELISNMEDKGYEVKLSSAAKATLEE